MRLGIGVFRPLVAYVEIHGGLFWIRSYFPVMEHQIALAAVVALMSLVAVWLLRKPIVNPGSSISSKTRMGFWYLGLLLIALGVVNLFFGFRDGEMFWVSKGRGYDGWLPYDGYKRAFIYLGALYSFSVAFGLTIIKVLALNRRKEQI